MFKKKPQRPKYDKTNKKAVLKCSICTGEQVAGFNIPLDLMDLDPNEVMEIVVFNGNSGNATHITDKEQIQHIVENLNGVEVKRSKPSLGYMGYTQGGVTYTPFMNA